MRSSILLFLFFGCCCAQASQIIHNEDDYYKLLTDPSPRLTGADTQERNLQKLLLQAWPEQGERGYIPSRHVRSAEERRAFIRALERLIRERLSALDDPISGSEDYLRATFSSPRGSRSSRPLAFQALLLSMDQKFDEGDIWHLIEIRLRNASSFDVFVDIGYLFDASKIHWTPAARAVFSLASREPPTALGIQRLFVRYQLEASALNKEAENTGQVIHLALPVRGLYAKAVENMLALIEGQHLWRDQGRVYLAQEAKLKLNTLTAALSRQLGQDFTAELARALVAPVRYIRVAQPLKKTVYWPEGARSKLREWQSGVQAPASLRWVRTAAQGESEKRLNGTGLTSRVGSNDERWWPASQEAYLDLAYRGLPELLRRQLSREGVLEVFRIWHAGSEDGSQTFLLAALLDEAVEQLASAPGSADLLQELQNLRIEIIATDYAYMPDRQGLTYRFDVSGHIGDLHHKWNLIAAENPARPQTKGAAILNHGVISHASSTGSQPLAAPGDMLATPSMQRERGLLLRSWADDGRVGELMGRLLALAPEVDVPSGQWLRNKVQTVAKHRYRFINQHWRIVELHGAHAQVVTSGTPDRLMRFEKGDMTSSLPRGFEDGDAFDLIVVTSVLPYIYGYYRQQGDASLGQNRSRDHTGTRLTPMEAAQSLLQKGARTGGWIIVDQATEEAAMEAGERSHMLDANYENWTDAWMRWVGKTLPKRDIELYLTREFGIERIDPARYENTATGG
jgi:hypothetical protein